MLNERGGFLSKIFMIPAGVAIMVGFFFLGYYTGKYHGGSAADRERVPSLPEITQQYLPKKEELTFYKTLTEKGEKTVSVDLKQDKKQADRTAETGKETPQKATTSAPKKPTKKLDISIERKEAPAQPKRAEKAPPEPATADQKKAPVPESTEQNVRYTVQIASYPTRELAEEETRTMKKKGYAAFVVASEVPEKGTWYRVRLGSFSNRTSAEKLAQELKNKENLSPLITVE